MKLEKFKEKKQKRIGMVVFTIFCILLISGVILYRTFAIFKVSSTKNIFHGNVQDIGDIQFMVYVEGKLAKEVPNKELGYTLDTSKSRCENGSIISWDDTKWSVEIKNVSTTKSKCYLYFDPLYVESELNGAVPDLGNELVAITFNETGEAVKAD